MKNKKGKFFAKGKFFHSFEKMIDYLKKWPEMPLDLECFEKDLERLLGMARLNKEANPEFTNRMMWMVVDLEADWVNHMLYENPKPEKPFRFPDE